MPRHPDLDGKTTKLGGSVFSALAPRIAALEGEIYPLHVGDTWMEPAQSWRALEGERSPQPHRYCNPHGLAPLLERIVEKLRSKNGLAIAGPGEVLVTPGATGALCAAAHATLSPGDEVLIIAPYWPLIRGIVINAHGCPVEVPLLHAAFDAARVVEALEARRTSRTVAVYISTPSNPVGCVLEASVLEAVAEFARRHDLWIWSDEVYEDLVYRGAHLSIATLAPERTLTAFSFSKAYGLAGWRCGYLTGPEPALSAARKATTYAWYSTPTPSQWLAERALAESQGWLDAAREAYREVGERAAARLGCPPPEGSTFLFLDVSEHLTARGLMGFLEDCLEDNLILATGSSFGEDFSGWVRLCYTSASPDIVMRGVERLARRLGRKADASS